MCLSRLYIDWYFSFHWRYLQSSLPLELSKLQDLYVEHHSAVMEEDNIEIHPFRLRGLQFW